MLVAEIIIIASTILGVDYSVHNPTAADIFLFDRVFARAQSGEPIVDPELAYRYLRDDGTLVVEKVLQPIPAGMKVEVPDIPYLTRLRPGETLQGRIVLKLPVREFGAYTDGPRDGKDHLASRVVLRIGFISAADVGAGTGVLKPDLHGATDMYVANYGLAKRLQKFFEADLGSPPIQLVVSRRN